MSSNSIGIGCHLRHQHFVLDANLTELLDEENKYSGTMSLIADLLIALGMSELGKMEIYPAKDLSAPGWSFIQPITTSHISGHYFYEIGGQNPNIRMDIYSCRDFDWRKALQIIHQHCSLAEWRANYLERGMLADERNVWEIAGNGAKVLSLKLLSLQNAKKELIREVQMI